MNPPPRSGLRRTLSKLQLLARQLVEGLATGLHRSPHKGASVTFKQHRPYVPGDEIRRLDWRVFARTDRFYVREYEQETNLTASLLVDLSGSMAYCGANSSCSKLEYARDLAGLLATTLIQQQDAVGLVTFDQKIRSLVPARSRPSHLPVLQAALAQEIPSGETSIAQVLRELAPRLGRRRLLILISDCLDEPSSLLKALAQLRHQQHEIIVFQVFDRDELTFPFQGWTRFESLEAEGIHLDADPAAIRKTYLENLARFRAELSQGCSRHQVQLCPVITDEPCESALSAHLSRRLLRR